MNSMTMTERLAEIPKLSSGVHSAGYGAMCIMEAVASKVGRP
jgi:hypothetical protein